MCPDCEDSMKHSSLVPSAIKAALTKHFEFFLTSAGVLLAILVTASELSRHHQDISLIFLLWLQGFILWAVHRHGWLLRHALFCEVQSVLQDRLKHHFTVMLSAGALLDGDVSETVRERLQL